MALQISINIAPDALMEVPTIPEDATPEQVAATQAQIDAATAYNLGSVYATAYVRILYVRTLPQDTYIFVSWYADAASRQAGDQPIKVYEYCAATSALTGDVYPAAYSYLKTLPEFEGAIDC